MIKETKTLKETVEKHRYCDECGVELHWSLSCSRATCEYCGKDLCNKCVGHEKYDTGDYRTVYCKTCWELGNDYRPLIEQHENEVDKLYEEWQNKCKNISSSQKK